MLSGEEEEEDIVKRVKKMNMGVRRGRTRSKRAWGPGSYCIAYTVFGLLSTALMF